MGHAFDGLVCIPNCDKIVPGMILGALRANVPTVFVSGGPMLPGTGPDGEGSTDLNTLFDGAGKVAAGTMTEEELAYSRGHGLPHLRQLLGHVHGELHELPVRGAGHRASGQRHRAGRLLRAHSSGQARRHEGDGTAPR